MIEDAEMSDAIVDFQHHPPNFQVVTSVSPAWVSFNLALREPYFPSKATLCSRQ